MFPYTTVQTQKCALKTLRMCPIFAGKDESGERKMLLWRWSRQVFDGNVLTQRENICTSPPFCRFLFWLKQSFAAASEEKFLHLEFLILSTQHKANTCIVRFSSRVIARCYCSAKIASTLTLQCNRGASGPWLISLYASVSIMTVSVSGDGLKTTGTDIGGEEEGGIHLSTAWSKELGQYCVGAPQAVALETFKERG